MKLKNILARDNLDNPIEYAKKLYPDALIVDAIFLNSSFDAVLALASNGKRAPYCLKLVNDERLNGIFKDGKSHLVSIEDNKVIDNGKEMAKAYSNAILDIVSKMDNYGGKLGEHGELIYDLFSEPVGPHYAVNLILGDRKLAKDALQSTPKSVVDYLGRGSFRAQADFQVLATSWTLSMSENGHPANRQFYIYENGKQIFYSASVNDDIIKGVCIHYPNKTVLEYELKAKLFVRRTIFILPQLPNSPEAIECQTIEIKNLSSERRKLNVVCTGMFGTTMPKNQMEDIVYANVVTQSSIIKDEDDNVVAIAPNYYPLYARGGLRFAILKAKDGYMDSFSTNYDEFVGTGDLFRPENGLSLSNKINIKGPNFFALGKDLVLEGNATEYIDTFVGAKKCEDFPNDIKVLDDSIISFLNKVDSHKKVVSILKEKDKEYDEYRSFLQVNTGNKVFDNYINYSLPFQVEYQTFVSRAFAMTQKGYREIGFREIQDIYASMYYLYNSGKQKHIKNLLTQWIENVYKMGYANHNFFYVGKEPGMCSDDQIWLIMAIYRYINLTGDKQILNEKFKIAGSKNKRKLSDTLLTIVRYSGEISVGKHGLPLLDSADWNDCLKIDPDYLNGPAKEKAYLKQIKLRGVPYGSAFENEYSESIMNAFLLVIALGNLEELLENEEDLRYVKEIKAKVTKSIHDNAYINDFYARVLINRDNKVHTSYIGSKGDKLSINPNCDGAYYVNSFSWSLLSEVASEEEIKKMLPIVEKHLKTPAGFRLCSEHDLALCGAKSSATDHYFIGDRENGGVFKHATMMLVVGALQAARRVKDPELKKSLLDNAYYMLDIVMPYRTYEDIQKYRGNPRFCTQYNNSKTEENIGPMLSGTATWLTLALYEIIGLKFEDGGFRITPSLRYEDSSFNANIIYKGAKYDIEIHKAPNSVGSNEYKIYLDGELYEDSIIYPDKIKKHKIVVEY